MPPPTVAEQQAKLGVSIEDSKAQRLKRQQARFRDRGGAFVPSNSNPLVDVLLARTVSGESPSKAHPKDVSAKRLSPSKARQTSRVTALDESRAVVASSKPKPPASRKRNRKAAELEVLSADLTVEPAPKRRGRPAKGKRKPPDADCDTEQQLPRPKSGSTSKGKGKQHDVSTLPSFGAKPKPRTKAKSNPAKAVVEVPASDDDRTLVEIPHKSKSNSDRKIRHGEVRDGAPIIQKRVLPPTDDSRTADTRTAPRIEAGKNVGMGSSQKRAEDKEIMVHDERSPKATTKRRVIFRGGDDSNDVVSSVKKRKVANSAPGKSKIAIEPKLVLRTTKEVEVQGNSKVMGNGKGRRRAEPAEEDAERHPDRTSKAKKRKKEDNCDDRPRKTLRFSDTDPPYLSSKKLKENQSHGEQKRVAKSRVKARPGAPPLDSATVPPSRAKRPKGPPLEVLERIKASAAQHLRCTDSEPDELDCLS